VIVPAERTSDGWRHQVIEALQDPPPLRERKKLRTREALISASQKLFAEKGYAATTLEEICQSVEVAPPTLFRYFESKAQLALARNVDWSENLRADVASADRDVPTLEVWRSHVSHLSSSEVAQWTKKRALWIAPEPVLRSLMAAIDVECEAILASGLATDAGIEPVDDVYAHLVATALVRGRWAVFRRWLERNQPYTMLAPAQMALIDFVAEELLPPREAALARLLDSHISSASWPRSAIPKGVTPIWTPDGSEH
jgi:AcrR family transcriptional regulator